MSVSQSCLGHAARPHTFCLRPRFPAPEKGVVHVATHFQGDEDRIAVTIEDSGPGIPEDQHETLFSPFVSSKKGRGTGLGLPVSQKIVAEHGGSIEVTNLPQGGARFALQIPAVHPETDGTTRLQ